jgi:hypothetical protein
MVIKNTSDANVTEKNRKAIENWQLAFECTRGKVVDIHQGRIEVCLGSIEKSF